MGKKRVEINPICGERLKTIIKEQKISQIEYAKKLNYSPEHLSAVINGRKSVTDNIARATVEWFPEYRIEWLLGYDDFKTKSELKYISEVEKTDEKEQMLVNFENICEGAGYQITNKYYGTDGRNIIYFPWVEHSKDNEPAYKIKFNGGEFELTTREFEKVCKQVTEDIAEKIKPVMNYFIDKAFEKYKEG